MSSYFSRLLSMSGLALRRPHEGRGPAEGLTPGQGRQAQSSPSAAQGSPEQDPLLGAQDQAKNETLPLVEIEDQIELPSTPALTTLPATNRKDAGPWPGASPPSRGPANPEMSAQTGRQDETAPTAPDLPETLRAVRNWVDVGPAWVEEERFTPPGETPATDRRISTGRSSRAAGEPQSSSSRIREEALPQLLQGLSEAVEAGSSLALHPSVEGLPARAPAPAGTDQHQRSLQADAELNLSIGSIVLTVDAPTAPLLAQSAQAGRGPDGNRRQAGSTASRLSRYYLRTR